MAKCDTGYLCRVCGSYVEDITESGLYLRYVLGEVRFEELGNAPEAHIRCEPEIAQYIVDRQFGEPCRVDDPGRKQAGFAVEAITRPYSHASCNHLLNSRGSKSVPESRLSEVSAPSP